MRRTSIILTLLVFRLCGSGPCCSDDNAFVFLSQEGSIELNPLPYGEAGVSLRSLSVPESQQEWPFEKAVQ